MTGAVAEAPFPVPDPAKYPASHPPELGDGKAGVAGVGGVLLPWLVGVGEADDR